jgi:ribonuclease HII
VSVIVAPACEVDRRGVHKANLSALARALQGLDAPTGALLLSDGFRLPQLRREHRAIIGGDGTSAAIAAASIVAKVTRDRLMRRVHASYPSYGFDGHVGYSTPQHREALEYHGPCPLHRRSFATVGAVQLSLLEG